MFNEQLRYDMDVQFSLKGDTEPLEILTGIPKGLKSLLSRYEVLR